MRPGRHPLAALAALAAPARPEAGHDEAELAALADAWREEPGRLGAGLRRACRERGERALLFVDQFEELFTLGAAPDERAAFLACLEGAADDASSPLRVAIALRADFLDRLADERRFVAELPRGLVLLAPPERSGLREALGRPVEAAGYRFESEALVDRMLASLEGARCPLPLLQFTASKLWDARDRERRLLTEASYDDLGGVEGALAAHADATLAALSSRERRLARDALVRLVTPERTRQAATLAELRGLAPEADDAAALARALGLLVDARLLALASGAGDDDTNVELVHESLIERWPTLRRWLDGSAHDAPFLARLRAASQQWGAGSETEGLLWREGAALEARAWYERRRATPEGERAALGAREGRFVEAVVALSERAQQRRRRAIAVSAAALVVIAFTVSLLAVRARSEAARARSEAARARDEARRTRNATRLAVAREKQADPTTVIALVRELEPPDLPRDWTTIADEARRGYVASAVMTHDGMPRDVAWSPDGQRIVSRHSGGQVMYVWRADGAGLPAPLQGHEGPIKSMKWSPDGQHIVSASEDKTVRVFRTDGKASPLILRGHEDAATSASWAPTADALSARQETRRCASFAPTARASRSFCAGTRRPSTRRRGAPMGRASPARRMTTPFASSAPTDRQRRSSCAATRGP